MELSWEEKVEVMVEWYKKVFEKPPVLPYPQGRVHLSSRSSPIVFTTPLVPLVGDRNGAQTVSL